jgi:hypothetical protein
VRDRCPYRADVHRRLIDAAARGRTITYSELGTGRGWTGAYLYRIAHEEDAAGRPPLTSIVVRKGSREPGPGLVEAMRQIGYLRPGETETEVFRRATLDVFAYWSGRDPDREYAGWRPQLTESPATWPRMARSRS